MNSVRYITGKNNGFPFLDIFGYLKNTHKNPKFGKVRQVPIREFPTKFPDCLTLPNLGFLWVFFKYPKISKNGNPLFFPVYMFYRTEKLTLENEIGTSYCYSFTCAAVYFNPETIPLELPSWMKANESCRQYQW